MNSTSATPANNNVSVLIAAAQKALEDASLAGQRIREAAPVELQLPDMTFLTQLGPEISSVTFDVKKGLLSGYLNLRKHIAEGNRVELRDTWIKFLATASKHLSNSTVIEQWQAIQNDGKREEESIQAENESLLGSFYEILPLFREEGIPAQHFFPPYISCDCKMRRILEEREALPKEDQEAMAIEQHRLLRGYFERVVATPQEIIEAQEIDSSHEDFLGDTFDASIAVEPQPDASSDEDTSALEARSTPQAIDNSSVVNSPFSSGVVSDGGGSALEQWVDAHNDIFPREYGWFVQDGAVRNGIATTFFYFSQDAQDSIDRKPDAKAFISHFMNFLANADLIANPGTEKFSGGELATYVVAASTKERSDVYFPCRINFGEQAVEIEDVLRKPEYDGSTYRKSENLRESEKRLRFYVKFKKRFFLLPNR